MWFTDRVFINKLYCHVYFRVLESCREHSYYLMLSVVVLRSSMSLRGNQNCQIMSALVRNVAFLNPHSSALHFSHPLFVYFCERNQSGINDEMSSWDFQWQHKQFKLSETCSRCQVLSSVPQISKRQKRRKCHFIAQEVLMDQNTRCVWIIRPYSSFSLISLAVIVFLSHRKCRHLQILGAAGLDVFSGSCWKSFWETWEAFKWNRADWGEVVVLKSK